MIFSVVLLLLILNFNLAQGSLETANLISPAYLFISESRFSLHRLVYGFIADIPRY